MRYLATVQPSPTRPTTLALGTRTSVKKTSFWMCSPDSMRMGFTSTPGVVMSISRKVMPCWGMASRLVRTRQKIQFASWAWVVHSLWPLQTKSSPSSTALICREARSEPEPGSE